MSEFASRKWQYESDTEEEEEEFVDFESDMKVERLPDEAILGLFVSDTDEEDFGGFSMQEEDDDTRING